jgi:hypothetical protein
MTARGQETANRRQETGGSKQETGDRKQETEKEIGEELGIRKQVCG